MQAVQGIVQARLCLPQTAAQPAIAENDRVGGLMINVQSSSAFVFLPSSQSSFGGAATTLVGSNRRDSAPCSSSSCNRNHALRRTERGAKKVSVYWKSIIASASSAGTVEISNSVNPRSNVPGSNQMMPSPAELARTIVDIRSEGTLSTLAEDEGPTATSVRFALDADGNPVFRLPAWALHTRNLAADNRASLHVQLEQPGRRKPQCTLRGRIRKAEASHQLLKLNIAWERRFGKDYSDEDKYYIMTVEQAFHAHDMGEEETWISGQDFGTAVADPLRDCAPRVVDDMNRQHWEDLRRFCSCHAQLEDEVEEASMTWVDRLGFNLRVLTRSPQNVLEIRIPFSREVTDERDARSSLTMMAQVAWEHERKFSPPDVSILSSFNI